MQNTLRFLNNFNFNNFDTHDSPSNNLLILAGKKKFSPPNKAQRTSSLRRHCVQPERPNIWQQWSPSGNTESPQNSTSSFSALNPKFWDALSDTYLDDVLSIMFARMYCQDVCQDVPTDHNFNLSITGDEKVAHTNATQSSGRAVADQLRALPGSSTTRGTM